MRHEVTGEYLLPETPAPPPPPFDQRGEHLEVLINISKIGEICSQFSRAKYLVWWVEDRVRVSIGVGGGVIKLLGSNFSFISLRYRVKHSNSSITHRVVFRVVIQ